MGFVVEQKEVELNYEEDNRELLDKLVTAMATVIDRHKTTLYPMSPLGTVDDASSYDVSTCPLCGALIGDSLVHARIHLGPPDMQIALMNAIER